MDRFLQVLSELSILPFCCYCKKAIRLNDKWMYLNSNDSVIIEKMANLSHGCCHLCHIEVKKELAELKKQRDK